jgi:membrane protease YdiL (CAAX protease family)
MGFKQNLRKLRDPMLGTFVLIYLIALIIQFFHDALMAISSLFVALVSFALILLALKLSEGKEVEAISIRRPVALGVFAGLFIIILWVVTLPAYGLIPEVSKNWMISHHAVRFSMMTAIPLLVLWFKGEPRNSMGLTLKNWKGNLKAGLIIGGVAWAGSFLFNPENQPILSGEISILVTLVAVPAAFLWSFFTAGFPEELFLRYCLQEHLSSFLKSRLSGLILSNLVFGWAHTPAVMTWFPGIPIYVALAYATTVQVPALLVYGVIWERTRNLIPVALTHTLADAGSWVMYVVQRLGL